MSEAFRRSRYNARVFVSCDEKELKAEMDKIGAEVPGIERMAKKAEHFLVRVDGLRTPAVLILKEEMLAKGGDCTIHRDAIVGKQERSGCMLMGTYKQFIQLLPDLRLQPFGLKYLADEIQKAIESYRSTKIPLPQASSNYMIHEIYKLMNVRTLVMGILNVTPDSFSDGGQHFSVNSAVEHAKSMAEWGADIIDIGGESTRPGSEPITAEEELSRAVPVIEKLQGNINIPISIDTYRADVARAAIDAGASIINDITGLCSPEMRAFAAERKLPVVIMHMKGEPRTMQVSPEYNDVIGEIIGFLRDRAEEAILSGLPEELIIIDPGIGFGKTIEHNAKIIKHLSEFKSLGFPILIGTSRKGFIGKIGGDLPVDDRLEGTAATVALSINNGANIIRVHDVKEMVRVARMCDAILRGG